jgi:hypothetical protein
MHVAVGIELRPGQERAILADNYAGTKDEISNKRQPMQT